VPVEAEYLSRDPEIMSGALCFKGTRVPVQNLCDYLEGSSSLEEFLEDFPSVSSEVAIAVLEAANAKTRYIEIPQSIMVQGDEVIR
jgi:uncharacterized protein (DUF433 family)